MRLRPGQWLDLVRAAYELARARWRLSHVPPSELLVPGTPRHRQLRAGRDAALRVGFAIPRVAARLPWRADCLVQAMAAQRWLGRLGVESRLHVGVRKPGGQLEAHAWLTSGDTVVTGGDASSYAPLDQFDDSAIRLLTRG